MMFQNFIHNVLSLDWCAVTWYNNLLFSWKTRVIFTFFLPWDIFFKVICLSNSNKVTVMLFLHNAFSDTVDFPFLDHCFDTVSLAAVIINFKIHASLLTYVTGSLKAFQVSNLSSCTLQSGDWMFLGSPFCFGTAEADIGLIPTCTHWNPAEPLFVGANASNSAVKTVISKQQAAWSLFSSVFRFL